MPKFEKGRSGNPGGRPKAIAEIRDLARAHAAEAIEALVTILRNVKAPAASRIAAANAILDRGWGKPSQDMNMGSGLTLAELVEASINRERGG